jgi:hypothetical protein
MAWTTQGLYPQFWKDMVIGTSWTTGTPDLDTATGWKLALHSDSVVDGSSPVNFQSTTPAWANTAEVSGTGWTATGISLTTIAGGSSATPTVAVAAGGLLVYDHTNDVSVPSTTLTGVKGCIIYFDTATAPYADPCLVAVNFGSSFSTSNGTFAITWNASGIFSVDFA